MVKVVLAVLLSVFGVMYLIDTQRGTVQSCPHCRAYVDVGDDAGPEGWDKTSGDDEASAGPHL